VNDSRNGVNFHRVLDSMKWENILFGCSVIGILLNWI